MRAPFVCFALLASLVPAQSDDPYPPAPELARFDRLLGDFTGSGEVWRAPDAPPVEWNATVHTRKVLAGHFVCADMTVEFPNEDRVPLRFLTFWGWDESRARFLEYAVTSEGEVTAKEPRWQGDALLTVTTRIEAEEPVLERWTITLSGDGYALAVERAVGAGPLHAHARGVFRRAAEPQPAPPLDAPPQPSDAFAEIVSLQSLVGSYRLTGEVQPVHQERPVPIRGTAEARLLFGGAALELRIRGDAEEGERAYESWTALGYDPHDRCFRTFGLDSRGTSGSAECVSTGRALVFTGSRMLYGQPLVERTVLERGDGGALVRMTAHAVYGGNEPYRSLRAELERLH